ncbi:hypothetical protein ACFHW1_05100 [Micromonospora sp. LOL_014]|uniref:hypothetical protein n=1 Tax=Micromonospora sp. LOL_014 TaxID=3345415 RepID=UPI003A8B84B8
MILELVLALLIAVAAGVVVWLAGPDGRRVLARTLAGITVLAVLVAAVAAAGVLLAGALQ